MARISIICITLLSTFFSSVALAPSAKSYNVDRREMFGIVGAAVTSTSAVFIAPEEVDAASLKTGASSPFTGDYDDPNHPGCLRQVKVVGAPLRGDGTRPSTPIIEVVGYDGNGSAGNVCTESDRPTREQVWKIQGKMKSNTEALVDFSPKGGPSNLVATWDGSGIVFPDGNKWTKVPLGTKSRLPKDMSTLKSD